jgi:peptide/nickel transport system permease protein
MLGYSPRRVIARHLLPGVGRVTASYAVADVVLLIIWAASLSFLGVGIQTPTPEWGSIMFEGRAVLAQAWWITAIPGILLVITGLSISLIADALLSEDAR